jgi:hypothetical protein
VFKTVGLIIVSTLLTSCSPTIEGWQTKQYIDGCSSRGGIDYISNFNNHAVCVDGYIVEAKTS